MKRVGFVFAMLIIALAATSAMAQNVGDNSYYFVTYYSNNVASAPDAVVRFINDGSQGTNASGDLWAAFYIFDDSQELTECCACVVTPDGILSEDVKTELTATPLTGKIPTRGVIKVISSFSSDPTSPEPTYGLRGTATHIQAAGKSSYATTETAFADANLGSAELSLLPQLCYFADTLLSGVGCSCTPEDHDF
ncbi:MAG: hypothetical protein WAU58_20345 [Terriglobales bacterium]|jgi:hypothetical protein